MKNEPTAELNRRSFLKGGSISTLMSLIGAVELKRETPAQEIAGVTIQAEPKVNCAVIGLGSWGREIVQTLSVLKDANVMAVCDPYPSSLRRGGAAAPKAEKLEDYRKILENKDIKAVVLATPSHKHREIAIEALSAGKHVYCEAPLAHTMEDARAIAQAARKAYKQVFQPGLQLRSDSQRHFLLGFIRAGAMGRPVMVRSQWHKKQSWRFASPNLDRERDLNWRLNRPTSSGLIGEIGIHQVDATSWYLNGNPVAVTGFGAVHHWRDGRDVPDTVQAIFEYPNDVNLMYDATLANSFDSAMDIFYGTDSAIMVREDKAWMFKEVDAPLLGWEVYAAKRSFYNETGIALVANATKLSAQGVAEQKAKDFTDTPLNSALAAFLVNSRLMGTAVEDFVANYGEDEEGLKEYLADMEKNKNPAAGYREGYEAAVSVIKANEAILGKRRIVLEPDWYDLG
ncbi:MAG: Gfo/Idh/MocA family oxidoreductase [Verrucomicrobia bacterium]|nr:Gfo/Idh/MocA family oxidoreductase [Verrucomicrobiota bacterium]